MALHCSVAVATVALRRHIVALRQLEHVDTDPCIDSDENFGVDPSGEVQFSGTIHYKCDVGVQVGGEPFSKQLNLDSTARGVHEARTCCQTKTDVVIIKLALTRW